MKNRRKSKRMNRFMPFLLLLIVLVIIGRYFITANSDQTENATGNQKAEQHADSTKNLTKKETNQKADRNKEVSTFSQVQKQTDTSIEEKVDDLLVEMTLEEKIGQLMVIGFDGKEINDHAKTMINEYKVGGIIYYDRNMESPGQVTKLSNDLQQLALNNAKKIPLLISIDQEGGQIVRMRDKVSNIPSQQELGKNGSSQAVYDSALKNGQELKTMGIHVNFAPVLDLSETDSRSFGIDPKKTAELGEQAIAGFTDAGITATLKHFPGNGRSDIDPHHETSSVEANQLDLENSDIYPFKKMIDEVDHRSFFTMVTHIKYPAYDKENPASISRVIISELLRKKLGYTGIVVTDDLEMGAVNKYFTYEDLGFSAIDAGADLLLVCHTLESQKEVFKGIQKAVQEKKLSEERIDEAVKRILTFKLQSIKETNLNIKTAENIVGK